MNPLIVSLLQVVAAMLVWLVAARIYTIATTPSCPACRSVCPTDPCPTDCSKCRPSAEACKKQQENACLLAIHTKKLHPPVRSATETKADALCRACTANQSAFSHETKNGGRAIKTIARRCAIVNNALQPDLPAAATMVALCMSKDDKLATIFAVDDSNAATHVLTAELTFTSVLLEDDYVKGSGFDRTSSHIWGDTHYRLEHVPYVTYQWLSLSETPKPESIAATIAFPVDTLTGGTVQFTPTRSKMMYAQAARELGALGMEYFRDETGVRGSLVQRTRASYGGDLMMRDENTARSRFQLYRSDRAWNGEATFVDYNMYCLNPPLSSSAFARQRVLGFQISVASGYKPVTIVPSAVSTIASVVRPRAPSLAMLSRFQFSSVFAGPPRTVRLRTTDATIRVQTEPYQRIGRAIAGVVQQFQTEQIPTFDVYRLNATNELAITADIAGITHALYTAQDTNDVYICPVANRRTEGSVVAYNRTNASTRVKSFIYNNDAAWIEKHRKHAEDIEYNNQNPRRQRTVTPEGNSLAAVSRSTQKGIIADPLRLVQKGAALYASRGGRAMPFVLANQILRVGNDESVQSVIMIVD